MTKRKKRIKEKYDILAKEMDLIDDFKFKARNLIKQHGLSYVLRHVSKEVLKNIPNDPERLQQWMVERPWREQHKVVRKLLKVATKIVDNEDKGISYKTKDGKLIVERLTNEERSKNTSGTF